MNPYLRISQKPPLFLYAYAQAVLNGSWPEMEPAASTPPIVSARPIEDRYLFEELDHSAIAVEIGVFFNNQYIFSVKGQKWLSATGGLLSWQDFNVEVISDSSAGSMAKKVTGNPVVEWVDYLDMLQIRYPSHWREQLENSVLLNQFDEKYIWLAVSREVATDIIDSVSMAYTNWQPPTPDSYTMDGARMIERAMLPKSGLLVSNMHALDCDDGETLKIAYAWERRPDGTLAPILAVDLFVSTSWVTIHHSVEEAIKGGEKLCAIADVARNKRAIKTINEELEKTKKSLLEKAVD